MRERERMRDSDERGRERVVTDEWNVEGVLYSLVPSSKVHYRNILGT